MKNATETASRFATRAPTMADPRPDRGSVDFLIWRAWRRRVDTFASAGRDGVLAQLAIDFASSVGHSDRFRHACWIVRNWPARA